MLPDDQLKQLTTKYDIAMVPGYLSYPAVSKWNQPITEEQVSSVFSNQIAGATTRDSLLYFHFPYCETLCYYCACYMRVTSKPKERYDAYLDALDKELALKIDRVSSGTKLPARQMHWGGGTPTYMDCKQIARAFEMIDRRVSWVPGATLSLEAYPDERTLSDEKVELLKSLGFTQVSFGIESLDPKVLESINRRHEIESIRHWVDKARSVGLGVHVDLVYGLPYQTTETFRKTIETVMAVRPDRLATFSFMYTPLSIKHQRAIPESAVPNSQERCRLYELLCETTAAHGYTRVGSDHWVYGDKDPLAIAAKSGDITYHFQGYEPGDRETFLGFGSSAISFAQGLYFQNLHTVTEYTQALDQGQLPLIRGASVKLNEDDKIRHRVIMKGIMSGLRIDKRAIEKQFGIVFDDYFAQDLERLREIEADGLVSGVNDDVIRITDAGRPFIRNVAFVFDRWFTKRNPLGANRALQVVS